MRAARINGEPGFIVYVSGRPLAAMRSTRSTPSAIRRSCRPYPSCTSPAIRKCAARAEAEQRAPRRNRGPRAGPRNSGCDQAICNDFLGSRAVHRGCAHTRRTLFPEAVMKSRTVFVATVLPALLFATACHDEPVEPKSASPNASVTPRPDAQTNEAGSGAAVAMYRVDLAPLNNSGV